jgi:hypothetical protein
MSGMYLCSLICLHGIVLNQLSTGTTLPLTLYCLRKMPLCDEVAVPDLRTVQVYSIVSLGCLN